MVSTFLGIEASLDWIYRFGILQEIVGLIETREADEII